VPDRSHAAPPAVRRRWRGGAGAAAFVLTLVFVVPAALVSLPSVAAAYPSSTVAISGHGYGHGIGLGQWGSLGYAIGADDGVGNYTYQQILDNYYGGTTLTPTDDATSMHDGNVIVAMTEANGAYTIAAAADPGVNVTYTGSSAPAVMFQPSGTSGVFSVWTAAGCAGPTWTEVGTTSTPSTSAADGGPVDLCTASGTLELHGTLTALLNSSGDERTVNTLPIEEYVADVAAAESPSTWATLGGPGPQSASWGFQQTEAQVVAARSYVEADPLGYGGYADTCDQTCQSYPGMRWENLYDDGAASDTAGQVMMDDGTSTVATTEYSASSGGYTTGDQFPAVPDDGDAVCINSSVCNPNHDWSVSVPVSTVEAAYPQIGTLAAFAVTQRNGYGDYGGRVEQMTISGSSGSVSVTGDAFAAAVGLPSDWFTFGGQASGGVGGYWIDAADGGVFSFGSAQFFGSMGGQPLNQPIVGIASTSDAGGYWEVASDGGIFSFGDARFHGSTGSLVLNKPVVAMAVTPDGGGYWLVASDGGIFAFGDAGFYGSTGSLVLNKPVIGMVPTHDGKGYWLVASDGGIFAYGDASFVGSLGSDPPPTPIVGVAPTTDGGGYWMLEADGTAHAFGDAPSVGVAADSPPLSSLDGPMSALIPDFSGQGFDAIDAHGQAFAFGDAPYFGDVTTAVPAYSGRAVGIAATPSG
jgi:SpoIID/LytB domain protein